jgi:large subunit ribosomal protein L15
MVTLNELPKSITTKPKKRLGRGYGSGKGGHTVGKGQKGQKSRRGATSTLLFQGTKKNKDFFRRTPWLRGKLKLKPVTKDVKLVKVSQLAELTEGVTINEEVLIKAGIISLKESQKFAVKIVFDKDPGKKFILEVPASQKVIDTVVSQQK